MLLNIEYLCKLNRLRDNKLYGAKKEIEVCTNADKILKAHENYNYETIEVEDNYLYDLDNKGIIDEIIRMTFYDDSYKYTLQKIENVSGTVKTSLGFYLKYKGIDEVEHPFDLLFRICEKAYFGRFKGKSEECYEVDHRSQGRLIALDLLCGNNEKFNASIKSKFNIDITNIDDFKYMLLDKDVALGVRKYITQVVANEGNKVAWNGRNQDYILKQKKVNGKLERVSEQIQSFSLDKKHGDDENGDGHDVISEDGVYKDDDLTPNEFTLDKQEEIKQQDNLYRHLLNNIDSILTKKQLLYLKAYLNNDENNYLKTISHSKDNQRVYKYTYRNKIKEYIEKYLNKDLYTLNKNNKFEFKESVLVGLETILKQNSNKEIFTTLCAYLQSEKNTALEKILIDTLYELDTKYYHPIVAHINFDAMFGKYIENDFIVVVQALQSAYNWHGKNNIVIYNVNRNDKELIVESKMKKIMNNNKIGFISKSKNDNYMSIRQLKEFLEEVEDIKLTNNTLKDVLNKYGYDIDLKVTSNKKIEVYRIFVLGETISKKKVIGRQKRQFDLTIDQSKDIEKYIDDNLKLDRLLNTSKNVDNHLRICDVRSFIEGKLDISRLVFSELYEILLQCNYLLDSKCGSKQINGVKVHAYKIDKVD